MYLVLLPRRPDIHPLSFLFTTVTIEAISLLPFFGMEVASGARIVATAESGWTIAYVAVFPSILAYFFYNQGVAKIGPAATAQYLNILPLLGAALAIFFLDEKLHSYHIIAMVLIILGIIVSCKGRAVA